MPPWLKLATGIAATGIVTYGYYLVERQAILARLGASAVPVFTAHGVTDASIRWTSDTGWTSRHARISGTAANNPEITAKIAALPGIHSAEWAPR